MLQDYWYYGLRLRSDLAFEGLPPFPAETTAPVFTLRQGSLPALPAAASPASHAFTQDDEGRVSVYLPGVFAFLLVDPEQALIEVDPRATMAEVEGYLLSYIAGVVLHGRGELPLHASCVDVGAGALVISGPSGQGKSTLAAALTLSGHPLLSDDITVVRFGKNDSAFAVPGSPNLRLCDDSIAAHALDPAAMANGRGGDRKKIWHRAGHAFRPVPIAAVIRLDRASDGVKLARLNGPASLLPLQELVYRFPLGRRMGAASRIAEAALHLAARVPVYRLTRSDEWSDLDRMSHLLLQLAGATGMQPQLNRP